MNVGIAPCVVERYKNQFEYCIDLKLIKFLKKCFKNNSKISILDSKTKLSQFDLIVITGGNDLVNFNQQKNNIIRNKNTLSILKKSLKLRKNILAICYGCLFISSIFGSRIIKDKKHRKKHYIEIDNKKKLVNSYHNYKILKINKKFDVIAKGFDDSVEAFASKKKKNIKHNVASRKIQKI